MSNAYGFLRCLETGSTLSCADAELVGQLNKAIGRGTITNRLGQTVSLPIETGLVNESRTLLYLVINEIPQMVLDEAISLNQLSAGPDSNGE